MLWHTQGTRHSPLNAVSLHHVPVGGRVILIFPLPVYASKEFSLFDCGNYKVILSVTTDGFELLLEKQGPWSTLSSWKIKVLKTLSWVRSHLCLQEVKFLYFFLNTNAEWNWWDCTPLGNKLIIPLFLSQLWRKWPWFDNHNSHFLQKRWDVSEGILHVFISSMAVHQQKRQS